MEYKTTMMLFDYTGKLTKTVMAHVHDSIMIPMLTRYGADHFVLTDYSQESRVAKYEQVGCLELIVGVNCKDANAPA